MVDYMAKIHILSHLCDLGEEVEHDVQGKGTSIDMAIQVVAYNAIAMLREELYILSKPPFQHFPERTEMNGVFQIPTMMEPCSLYE